MDRPKGALEGEAASLYAYDLAKAAMAGQKPPDIDFDLVEIAAFRTGVGRFSRDFSERMDRVAKHVSEDPDVQKIVREHLASVLVEAELSLEDMMFEMTRQSKVQDARPTNRFAGLMRGSNA